MTRVVRTTPKNGTNQLSHIRSSCTQIDDCPKHVLAATKEEICTAIKQDSDKKPFEIRKGVDVDMVVERMDILTPVVLVSSVTGQGLPLLCNILLRLPKRRRHKVGGATLSIVLQCCCSKTHSHLCRRKSRGRLSF